MRRKQKSEEEKGDILEDKERNIYIRQLDADQHENKETKDVLEEERGRDEEQIE